MGVEFSVLVGRGFDVKGLLAQVPAANLKLLPPACGNPLAESPVLRACIEGRSTRGVECFCRPGQFVVHVQALASAEDYELALQIVEVAADILEAPIQAEGIGHPISRGELRAVFDGAWVMSMQRSAVRALEHISGSDGGKLVTVPALFRACHFGPGRLAELRASTSGGEIAVRVIEEVRRIQYMDCGDYSETVTYQGTGENGSKFTYAAWLPTVKYWFPKTDYFFVGNREEDAPYLPACVLRDLPPDKLQWLDDAQVLVETFSQSEWAEFMNSTHNLRCQPHAEAKRRTGRARRKRL